MEPTLYDLLKELRRENAEEHKEIRIRMDKFADAVIGLRMRVAKIGAVFGLISGGAAAVLAKHLLGG